MRKIVSLLVSLAALATMSTVSHAAFATIAKSTYTASIAFAGTGNVWVSYELRNISNNVSTTTISWSNVVLSTTKWKAADQYILLHTTFTAAAGGVQLYTNNKAADANPLYTGVSTATAAGLVAVEDSSTTLPMCWRVTDVSTTTLNIVRGTAGFPDRLWEQTLGSAYPCFIWMVDAANGGFYGGWDYITVKDASKGIQHGEITWGNTASPDYIYFGADFTNAVTPRTYRTNTIRLEAFTE